MGDTVMAKCEHCDQDEPKLIAVAGHSVCPTCIEALSAQIDTRSRKLCRRRKGKQVAGVCAGIADHVEVDRDTVRVVFILLTVFTGGAALIAYVLLTYFLPIED